MTVLIVDDSPQFRALIRTVLAGLVDEVNECADGDEAVAAYGAQRPDWVLMDLQMARMGGLEATRRILAADRDRARPHRDGLRRCALAGGGDRRWRLRIRLEGQPARRAPAA